MGKNKEGVFLRVHEESWKKFKSKLKDLSSRKSVKNIKASLEKIKVYARGWLNYYGIASMKRNIETINSWLYHRIRMCIWKQWKEETENERKKSEEGIPYRYIHMVANSRRGH